MPDKKDKSTNCPISDELILAAISNDSIWEQLSAELGKQYHIRRETNGLRAFDVLMLLRPAAVIAETDLPGLSGVLLARLLGHNRYLSKVPVILILSREFLIEEFWAKESGAITAIPAKSALKAIPILKSTIEQIKPVSDDEWQAAEEMIHSLGGPAAAVANELERQLIGASILTRLAEIDIGRNSEHAEESQGIPLFIGNALGALASVLEFAQAGIALFDSGDLYIVDNEAFSELLDREAFIKETRESASIYIGGGQACLDGATIQLPPVRHELPGPREPASTFFALPLSGRQGVYGLLSIMTYKQIAVREYFLRTLSLIGAQLAVNLERALFFEEVRRLSVTDSLTGLSNRRAIIARLESELRRSIRYKTPFSLAICDIDDFKQINDTYGHQAGDAILKSIANIIKTSVREVDLAGRWGGEEIAMLFPQTDIKGAMIACERVRKQIEDFRIEYRGHIIKTTISIGVASIDPEQKNPITSDDLIGHADRAMYAAKHRGKNQVVSYEEIPL